MSTGHHDRPGLIADIGGTHARFALVPPQADTPVSVMTLRCADHAGFSEAADAFLRHVGGPRPRVALCAIATAVGGDQLRMTNHAWAFSVAQARRDLALEKLRFINDFAAQALAIPHLPADSREHFGGGQPLANRPIAVLGPGTGLGASGLIPTTLRWVPIEGEGGHVTFAPHTRREAALADRLRQRFGHCSAERVASGIGLPAVHQALCEMDGVSSEELTPEIITRRATDAACPYCREAVSMLCLGLATTASNLAVTLGALGGVYLCGGILPRLGALFDRQAFRARFEDKGRFRDYLAAVPTYLVHASNPALLGLARNLELADE